MDESYSMPSALSLSYIWSLPTERKGALNPLMAEGGMPAREERRRWNAVS
jgi:hypothetical protein